MTSKNTHVRTDTRQKNTVLLTFTHFIEHRYRIHDVIFIFLWCWFFLVTVGESPSRIFKPSVVGRAEMLTTREECDPTTTNQQRHLASKFPWSYTEMPWMSVTNNICRDGWCSWLQGSSLYLLCVSTNYAQEKQSQRHKNSNESLKEIIIIIIIYFWINHTTRSSYYQ